MANKSKVNMPKEFKKKCNIAIHTATVAAGASGLIPIPVADTVPISSAQVAMIVSLGKIFDMTISKSVGEAIVKVGLAQATGRAVVSSAFKAIPGLGTIAGMAVGSVTAVALTETIGWMVADDFYRMYCGNDPEDIGAAINDIRNSGVFDRTTPRH